MSREVITQTDLRNILDGVLPSSSSVSTWQTLPTSSITLTRTYGAATVTVTNVVENNDWLLLEISLTTSGATSAGGNIWSGSITLPHTMVMNTVVETTYYSAEHVQGIITSDGACTIRAMDAISSTSHVMGLHFRLPIQK